jgi:hypothetical protein
MTVDHARRAASYGFTAAIWAALALWLAACSPAQQTKAVVDGQMFCAKATATGPLVVAIADASGVPVSVIGMTSAAVQGVCATIAAIPVTPPVDPGAAPVVAVVVPPVALK